MKNRPKKPHRGVQSRVELPPPNTKRWVARRKADVVLAISRRLITAEEACRRYNLTPDELSSWQTAYQMHGIKGLLQSKRLPRRSASEGR